MNNNKILIGTYIVVAILALIITWYHNILFMQTNAEGFMGFIHGMYANHAAASIANDILFLGIAVNIFMVVEAKRLGIKYVWLYIVLSFVIAISVTVPIFLAVRQRKINASS
jgi:hypothetical protein